MTSIGGVGLAVADADRSAAFYGAAFGMVESKRFDLPHMLEVIVGTPGGTHLALMQYKRDGVPARDGEAIKLVFDVDDAAATVEAVRRAGGSLFYGPEAVPQLAAGAVLALVVDPDGYLLELVQGLDEVLS